MPSGFLPTFAIYFVIILALAGLWFLARRRGKPASQFLRDLTERARAGTIDPVVGREEEIERIIHIICRRTKNNPLLLGEPGVGKTAIVEGLARRIADGDVPDALKDKEILELNLSELISGTKYRGEFEQRLRAVTQALEAHPRSSILFVDEIHLLEQTKGVEGALSASDVLKPALARGDLPVIGATTFAEYEKYIRSEPALDRRFQPVLVGEPTPAAALAVLRGVKALYEKHHGVDVDDAALEAAVSLSKKLKTRHLPDKAIDLIDEACAKVAIEASGEHRLHLGMLHGAAEEAKRRHGETHLTAAADARRIRATRRDLRADAKGRAADKVVSAHFRSLGIPTYASCTGKRPCVTRDDVASVVAEWAELARRER